MILITISYDILRGIIYKSIGFILFFLWAGLKKYYITLKGKIKLMDLDGIPITIYARVNKIKEFETFPGSASSFITKDETDFPLMF